MRAKAPAVGRKAAGADCDTHVLPPYSCCWRQ
jgi:hypothetical protein